MNETPIFMKHCIFAIRADKSLAYAVYKAANEIYGHPVTENEIKNICDRPKTPKLNEFRRYKQASSWVAKFFNPVFMAFAKEMKDEEMLTIWRQISRKDIGNAEKMTSAQERRRAIADQYIIKFRERDRRRDWSTVK